MNHEDLRHRHDAADSDGLTFTFTETELHRIVNALQTAAVKFQECAAIVRAETPGDGYRQIAGQFDRQAAQALCIARRLNQDDQMYPLPEGYRRRPGVEYGCGDGDCTDCYSPETRAQAIAKEWMKD